jgi:ubiquinone biosynthesis protein
MSVHDGMLKIVLRRAARRCWVGRNRSPGRPEAGRFTRHEANRVVSEALCNLESCADKASAEPSIGARMNVHLARVTLAAHRALTAAGIEKTYATELVGDAAWWVYEKWGSLAAGLSWVVRRDPLGRLRFATDLFRRFPFNPPGYLMEDISAAHEVAFDVRRCPVAEYFRRQGASDVCVATWCNLDYALAEQWGSRLERAGTLAAGADRCDFRWKVPNVVGPRSDRPCSAQSEKD